MQLQVVALQPHPAQKARPVNLLRALQQDHEKKNKKKKIKGIPQQTKITT